MKKITLKIAFAILFVFDLVPVRIFAQAPPSSEKVMLQAFYWDSYSVSKWTKLTSQASELAQSFDYVWLPPSNYAGTTSSNMGYIPVYWFNQLSAFGTQDELKTLITTLRNSGTGCIADIVVNHRGGVSSWTDFPVETYNGITYSPNSAWICNNDECVSSGFSATGASDTGDGFSGARDLDHTNTAVQDAIKGYLSFMKNEMGFAGWRYDMTKGYSGYYNSLYNNAVNAEYSVGEYWDGSYDKLYAWLNAAQWTSTTFDFAFKYQLNAFASTGSYSNLVWTYNGVNQPAGLIHNPNVRRYATTFIDNHDTYTGGSGSSGNIYTGNVLVANAFMLSSPGIPCVLWNHWASYKSQIQAMIAARKAVGVHSQSTVVVNEVTSAGYAATVTGSKGSLFVKLGNTSYAAPSGYTMVTSGQNYAIYISTTNSLSPVLNVNLYSGTYFSGQTVSLSATNNASIYYTLDGSTPTASSLKYSSAITLPVGTVYFNAVAINANGNTSKIASYVYQINDKPSSITLGFKPPVSWPSVYAYVWEVNGSGAVTQLSGGWPGTAVTTQNTAGFYKYTVSNFTQPTIYVVFNKGSNQSQTVDLSTMTDKCWDYTTLSGTVYSCAENATCGLTTGENATREFKSQLVVYPTQISGTTTLNLPASASRIMVTNMLGKCFYDNKDITGTELKIDFSTFSSGVYFITLHKADGLVETQKVVKF